MIEENKPRRTKRFFTPVQKYNIIKDVEQCDTLKEGLDKHQLNYSVYRRWKRQLEVGVQASLRNGKPLKSPDLKRLELENKTLKETVLNQAILIANIKKEMGLD